MFFLVMCTCRRFQCSVFVVLLFFGNVYLSTFSVFSLCYVFFLGNVYLSTFSVFSLCYVFVCLFFGNVYM